MVSNASEDLPEPERPVNTTSLSRGISTSMFFKLCSRAPRMVIARNELADCWRRALRISSISAFPGARVAARRFGARRGNAIGRQWLCSEHRKNGRGFPAPRARHQRIVGTWQQRSASEYKKPAKSPAFSNSDAVCDDQYFATTGPPNV